MSQVMGYTYKGFEIAIGLEVHVQMNTQSKIFSSDQNKYGGEPNNHVHPVTLALPGTLPVINREAIYKAVHLAYAIGAQINVESRFDRKHYNYPDLPKGYQITQNYLPICERGTLSIPIGDVEKEVRFHHIHLEEDAGKSIHSTDSSFSLIDLNRAGVPLIEIVTEPDLRSGEEVYVFIQELQRLVRWLKISNADMEKGELRCDCNVSVRKIGAPELGERCEIKNLNSKKFARESVEIEARNQVEKILAGEEIHKATLHYDPKTKKTTGTREKENDKDYRYFPDPDLPPIFISKSELAEIKESLPTLPRKQEEILKNEYGLSAYQAKQICSDVDTADYFMEFIQSCSLYPQVANLIINQILPYQNEHNIAISEIPASMANLTSLLQFIDTATISNTAATKQVLPILLSDSSKTTNQVVEELGLNADNGDTDIMAIIEDALKDCQSEVQKYKGGKKALFGFFMGEVMKKTQGKLQPKEIKVGILKYLEK